MWKKTYLNAFVGITSPRTLSTRHKGVQREKTFVTALVCEMYVKFFTQAAARLHFY